MISMNPKTSLKQFLSGKNQPQSQPRKSEDPMRILIDLLKMIMNPQIVSSVLIQYMDTHQIDPNTYLPSVHQKHIQMPLIFHCCSQTHLHDFFMYLINHNVNVRAEMVSENPISYPPIELLYYSQIAYLPTLILNGAQLKPEHLNSSCDKLLLNGNITKLITLYKHGAIKKDELLQITQISGLIFRVLDRLYEKVYLLCQEHTDEGKLKIITEEIMKNYLNTFKLFFKNGVSVNQIEDNETFLQKVLNTYFIDLIKLTTKYQPSFDHVDFLHYSNFDLTNRQVMKIYYNEVSYQEIKEFLRDKIIPEKINIKKVAIKKKITS